MQKINIISLGCSKNLVDAELLARQLERAGYRVDIDAERVTARVVIVNTCGFIGDAKEESINEILAQVERKRLGRLSRLFVMGCLSQRYATELKQEIPEVDAWFGKFDWKNLLATLGKPYNEAARDERRLSTPPHYAYLKISEGCDRGCSYCAIPLMTGPHRSRPLEEITREARQLAEQGVKELLVIAQDTTYYGVDLHGRPLLPHLVDKLADIPGIEWIRLHYTYPAAFPVDLLAVMRERPNVCKYLDIALQHCTDHMLQLMRRGVTAKQTRELIHRVREEVPGVALRTTLMTGHPGETPDDFREMISFVQEMQFERLGVFTYSHEEDTYCDKYYRDDVPAKVKHDRATEIIEQQRHVSANFNLRRVGQQVRVLVDRAEGELHVGRTEIDSPGVDPEVFIHAPGPLDTGSFQEFTIISADDYDIHVA
ncbi:MAG: 30S ribosomal protein S12 methylthiotransferase RimO [Odoribacteraceae bacterium]|nr:30S ribosomal protein S12 methylthiotransferase RimO [Odoribacteraceae bacterium]